MEKYACWQFFLFVSDYFGSHWERGEGDEEEGFLFHPRVDLSRWRGIEFSHGSRDRCELGHQFFNWLDEELVEGEDWISYDDLEDGGQDLYEVVRVWFNEEETAILRRFLGTHPFQPLREREVKEVIFGLLEKETEKQREREQKSLLDRLFEEE